MTTATTSVGEVRYCPACLGEALTRVNGRCLWCDTRTRPRRSGPQFDRYITDDHLVALHKLHVGAGMSVRGLAREVWARFGYSSPASCREAIQQGWQRLALTPRSQQEGSAVAGRLRRALDAERVG